jgi:ATP-dependent DNA ligase
MKFNEDFVLNGEILVTDSNDKILERSISNGIIRRDEKTEDELNRIIYKVWDIIPYKDFLNKEWKIPYKKRLEILNMVASSSNGKIQIVDTCSANNKEEVLELFNKKYSEGEEGVVVKTTDGIWKDGKPWWQVKVKSEKDCDLRILDFVEGKGTYASLCGSMRCVSEDRKLEVYVKPRTPDIAKEIWDNRDYYLDKIVSVKYNEKIERKDTNTISLFLPVFIEIRDDKIIADNLEDIK